MFRKKPPSRLEALQETVKDVGSSVGESVVHGWEAAARKASDALHAAGEALHTATSAAGTVAGTAGTAVSGAKESAQEAAGSVVSKVREGVAHLRHEAADTAASKAKASKSASKTALKKARSVQRQVPEVAVEDTSSKWLWLGLGMCIGVILGLLLAPTTGRRSRALLKDKVSRAGHGAADLGQAAVGKATDLSHRAAGAVHRIKSTVSGAEDTADDITIADRVRTALGQNPATRNLEHLNVDCVDGVVTLRGPMVDTELQATIESIVRGVKGVRDVRSELLVEDAPEDSATFVG